MRRYFGLRPGCGPLSFRRSRGRRRWRRTGSSGGAGFGPSGDQARGATAPHARESGDAKSGIRVRVVRPEGLEHRRGLTGHPRRPASPSRDAVEEVPLDQARLRTLCRRLHAPEAVDVCWLMAGRASLQACALARSSSRRSGGADSIDAQPVRKAAMPAQDRATEKGAPDQCRAAPRHGASSGFGKPWDSGSQARSVLTVARTASRRQTAEARERCDDATTLGKQGVTGRHANLVRSIGGSRHGTAAGPRGSGDDRARRRGVIGPLDRPPGGVYGPASQGSRRAVADA